MKKITVLMILFFVSMNMYASEIAKHQLAQCIRVPLFNTAVSLLEQYPQLYREVIENGKDAQALVAEEIQLYETVGAKLGMHESSEHAEMREELKSLQKYIENKKSDPLP